ncbi:hypothetical protein R1sor_011880 [Riccia sorocarpa]|uniref:Reverse transcriptase zinc-binding domain-containing protein n=1 Tax=Riccia sorocarpa TaxID=122646 RepID=A0ABD3I8B6_9MARC
MVELIEPYSQDLGDEKKIIKFYENHHKPGTVWAWPEEGSEKHNPRKPPEDSSKIRSYKINKETLNLHTNTEPPDPEHWHLPIEIITMRVGKGKKIKVPTNNWRFPSTPHDDPQRWCRRCELQQAEDTEHVFWSCPKFRNIWRAIGDFFVKTQDPEEKWRPGGKHSLLAEKLPRKCELWDRNVQQWRIEDPEDDVLETGALETRKGDGATRQR